jgi:DNA repair exonuclease SbcCD ATPase subunit
MAQQANNQEEQWFLRTGGDTVFGPVTPEGLVVWAEQGRVLPGHDVSTDRKKWVPAVSLPFLKMQWYVDDGEGELRGPLNRAAAEALVKSGKVSETAQIIAADEVDLTDDSEEKTKAAADKVANPSQKALTQRILELELQLNERAQPEAAGRPTRTANQLTQERDALASKVTELQTLCDTLKRNAEKDLRTAEKRAEQLRGQNKKLEEQVEEMTARLFLEPPPKDETSPLADETLIQEQKRLQDKLAEAEINFAEIQEQLDILKTERDQLQDKLNALGSEQVKLEDSEAIELLKLEELHEELNAAKSDRDQLQEGISQKAAVADSLKEELERLKEAVNVAEGKSAESDRKTTELAEHLNQARLEIVQWRDECERREKERHEAFSLSEAVERQYGDVLSRTEQMKEDFNKLHLAYEKCVEETKKAQAKALDAERDFADLLSMANTRDTEYLEKITELERFSSQSPEKIAQFYSDQAAVFQLLKQELEILSQDQEVERQHLEQLKQLSAKRSDALQERKQTLTRKLGNSPAEMTRLSAREQTSDPASARIRTEFDNLRFTHDRDMRATEERARELTRKLQAAETEANRLKALAREGERSDKKVQELSEQIQKREFELSEERRGRESERLQFQSNNQALLARLESLEHSEKRETQEPPVAEAKASKLATWMHLK